MGENCHHDWEEELAAVAMATGARSGFVSSSAQDGMPQRELHGFVTEMIEYGVRGGRGAGWERLLRGRWEMVVVAGFFFSFP